MTAMFIIVDMLLAIDFLIIAKQKYSTYRNYVTLFSVMWMIVACGANFGVLLGYYQVSPYVNIALIIGAIVFGIMAMIPKNLTGGLSVSFSRIRGLEDLRLDLILILNIINILILIPLLGTSISVITNGSWTELRSAYYSIDHATLSNFHVYYLEYIFRPCRNATVIIGLILSIGKHKKGIWIIVLGIVECLIDSLLTAGRGPILSIIYYLLWAIFLDYEFGKNYIKKYLNLKYILVIGLVIIITAIITADRSGTSDNILKIIYQYNFVGPIYLSQLLEKSIPGFIPNYDFMFGWATFGFLFNLPLTVGLVLGQNTLTSNYWISSYIASKQLCVGEGLYTNAMTTCYYPFIMDWGTLGILIGPLLLSLASCFILTNLRRHQSIFWAAIAMFWAQTLFATRFSWTPLDIPFLITVLFILIFCYRGAGKLAQKDHI